MDLLPGEVLRPFEQALVSRLSAEEIARALGVTATLLRAETRRFDGALADRLEAALMEMSGSGDFPAEA